MGTLVFYFLLLFVASMILTAFKPKIKGWMGEKAVSDVIESLPKGSYIVLNNIMLKTSFGTAQ